MALVPGLTKIGFNRNCRNIFNIQSPTHLGAVHINNDGQVTYDIQLRCSWTPWKVKEIPFPMELFSCPNSYKINRNRQTSSCHTIRVCETPTCELNHSSAIQIASTSFLLVFLIALAGISLCSEVNSCHTD
jgi:hypothetical protein